MKTCLIAGATGLIGRRLVALCRDEARYETVHVVARRPVWPAAERGFVQHVVDFERLAELDLDGARVEDVFCALGTTRRKAGSTEAFRRVDHDYVVELARLALRHGARRFLLVSSYGADPGSLSFYQRVKGATEGDVAALGLPQVLIFRPSLLRGPREEFRLAERLSDAALTIAAPLVPRRVRPVPDEVLARAMLRAACDGGEALRVYESDEIQRLGRA